MSAGKSGKPQKADFADGFPDKKNVSVRADRYIISWISPKKIFGATNGGITNQTFGATPMGSGLLILLAAGAGYATLKKRKSNR